MSDALRTDLEGARELDRAVELYLLGGEKLMTGLHHWPEEEDWFSVYSPQTLGDTTTTRKVFKDMVTSWTVTDVKYGIYG